MVGSLAPAGKVDAHDLIHELVALPDAPATRQWLAVHDEVLAITFTDELADALKSRPDPYLRADLLRSSDYAQRLIDLGELSGNPLYRALGLRAMANIKSIGQREFEPALALYDEAA